jgi:quinol monooxygenase YgiN
VTTLVSKSNQAVSESPHLVVGRRRFILTAAAGFATFVPGSATPSTQEPPKMHGLIGKITAIPGQRDALTAILVVASASMPGCLSYVVAKDRDDDSGIWVTEVWDSEASHAASLTLPAVKEAIAKGRPLIEGFGPRYVTTPIGGHGLGAR